MARNMDKQQVRNAEAGSALKCLNVQVHHLKLRRHLVSLIASSPSDFVPRYLFPDQTLCMVHTSKARPFGDCKGAYFSLRWLS
jgi:hypothetical protein